MLKGIPSIIQPDLLKILSEMGHGDTIVLADAHFPAESLGIHSHVIRYDGQPIEPLLDAVMQLIPLDQYTEHPVFFDWDKGSWRRRRHPDMGSVSSGNR